MFDRQQLQAKEFMESELVAAKQADELLHNLLNLLLQAKPDDPIEFMLTALRSEETETLAAPSHTDNTSSLSASKSSAGDSLQRLLPGAPPEDTIEADTAAGEDAYLKDLSNILLPEGQFPLFVTNFSVAYSMAAFKG